MLSPLSGSFEAVFFNVFRQILAIILGLLLALQPLTSYAQLAADTAAPAMNQPTIGAAPNGVPLVDIAAPNGAGVSHNQYQDFNIDNRGAILNNSAVVGTSTLGGVVLGNPNLTPGAEAGLIINEVTSTNPSALNGALEVHGAQADVVVANPNGITVDGLETINIDRFSLSTGRPELNSTTGALERFNVNQGTITIEQLGLNTETATHTDIAARVAEVLGQVRAGQSLNVILGRNDVDYDSLLTTVKASDGSTKPALALDAAEFGAIQAGRIKIMATEDGVGVKTASSLVTNLNDIVIDAAGTAQLKQLSAKTDATITARDVVLEETVYAEQNLNLSAENSLSVESSGIVGAQNNTTVTAATVSNNGVLGADLNADATFAGGTGTLTVNATTVFTNNGAAYGASLALANLSNTASGLVRAHGSTGDFTLTGALTNNGAIAAQNTLTFNGTTLTNTDLIYANNALTLSATGTITNTEGAFISETGDISITAARFDNVGTRDVVQETTTLFQYKNTRMPNWSGHITSGRFLEDAWDGGQHSHHLFIANPDKIDISGWGPNTWEDYAPQTPEQWDVSTWTLVVPDEAHNAGRAFVSVTKRKDNVGAALPAEILARQGQITINVGSGLINNDNGVIAADTGITLNGGSLINTGTTLEESIRVGLEYRTNTTIRSWGWFIGEDSPNTPSPTDNNYSGFSQGHIGDRVNHDIQTIGRLGGTIAAGNGNVTGSLSGDIALVEQKQNTIDGADISGIIRFDTGLDASQALRFRPSLYKESTSNRYQLEQRFAFTNIASFYGSDYFLDRLGLNPDSVTKRLGDAVFDTNVIAREIQRQTGQRFLAAYTTDASQMQALLDNAASFATALNIAPGITLSEEMVAQLTNDIVWYEEQQVAGETVLVPKLYLKDTQRLFEAAAITGDSISLVAANVTLLNSALAATGGAVDVQVAGNYTQKGGRLTGDTIALTSQNIAISAAIDSVGNGTNRIGSILNSVATVTATDSVSFGALGSVSLDGAAITSGADTSITAGDAINIGTDTLTSFYDYKSERADITTSRTENLQSTLQAGNQLTITSNTGDVTLKAAQLQADAVDITGQEISIETATDTSYARALLKKESTFWQSSRDAGQVDETVLNTTIEANTLNLNASQSLTAEVKRPEQGGDKAEAIAALSAEPGLGYLAQVQPENVILVVENDREWNEHQKGLTQTGGIVLSLAIAAATFGAGSALAAGAGAGTTAASAGAAQTALAAGGTVLTSSGAVLTSAAAINAAAATGATFTTLSAASTVIANAALTSLATTAATSAINQDFDPQAALKSLGTSVATAGLTQVLTAKLGTYIPEGTGGSFDFADRALNIGTGAVVGETVESAVYGTDWEIDSALANAAIDIGAAAAATEVGQLEGNIGKSGQIILHAGLGAATAALKEGNLAAGAIGAVAGETFAETLGDPQNQGQTVANAKLAGGLVAVALGQTGDDITIAADAGGNAAEFNALSAAVPVGAAACAASMVCVTAFAGLMGITALQAQRMLADNSMGLIDVESFPDQSEEIAKTSQLPGFTPAEALPELPGYTVNEDLLSLIETFPAEETIIFTLPGFEIDESAGGMSVFYNLPQNYYPDNDGFIGERTREFLMPGDVVDRYGSLKRARYASPEGTPDGMRALPPNTTERPYFKLKVLKPIEVETGTITPAYDELGLGTQHYFPVSLDVLQKKGFIEVLESE